jgi:nucleoid DNA-binding protein
VNKAELISHIAEKTDLTKAKTQEVYDILFKTISDRLKKGDEISIPQFGKFSTKKRPARKGRNPQTQKEINIPEQNQVKFSVAKALKEEVNTAKGKKK